MLVNKRLSLTKMISDGSVTVGLAFLYYCITMVYCWTLCFCDIGDRLDWANRRTRHAVANCNCLKWVADILQRPLKTNPRTLAFNRVAQKKCSCSLQTICNFVKLLSPILQIKQYTDENSLWTISVEPTLNLLLYLLKTFLPKAKHVTELKRSTVNQAV